MKYKVCNKCGEIVTKTGFISSKPSLIEAGRFAKCHNKKCGKYYSKSLYEKLKKENFE